MTQALKSITIQLPEEDFLVLERKAQELGVDVEIIVQSRVHQTIRSGEVDPLSREAQLGFVKFLREAGPIFQQAAREMNLSEEDVLRMSRAARREVAEERHQARADKL